MVKFEATLKHAGKFLKLDSELEAEVIFTVPASEIAEIIKLVTFKGKRFKVVIMEVGEK